MKKLLIVISILIAPLGIHRLLKQSWLGVFELMLFFNMYVFINSSSRMLYNIGWCLLILCMYLYCSDIYKIYNNKFKDKGWSLTKKILFFILGLIASCTLCFYLAYAYLFYTIDGKVIWEEASNSLQKV